MRAAILLSIMLAAWSSGAEAQPAGTPEADPAHGVQFLPRFAFHFGAEHLSSDDPRFVWDANYGGDVDFVDYGLGRATFYANYHVVLGDEFHAFDPNQGNYILGMLVSARVGGLEAALNFHHESRHLSDRPKPEPVDWNMLGARVTRSFALRHAALDARVDMRGVVQRSFVDYEWEVAANLRGRYPVRSWLAVISDLHLRRLGVDGSQNRSTQTGARVEGGIRLEGRGAAVELFVAAERRIDPFPTSLGVERWVSAGFRIASR